MPIVNGKYVAPTWTNGSSPAISAAELQAMSDTIAQMQGGGYSFVEIVPLNVRDVSSFTYTSGDSRYVTLALPAPIDLTSHDYEMLYMVFGASSPGTSYTPGASIVLFPTLLLSEDGTVSCDPHLRASATTLPQNNEYPSLTFPLLQKTRGWTCAPTEDGERSLKLQQFEGWVNGAYQNAQDAIVTGGLTIGNFTKLRVTLKGATFGSTHQTYGLWFFYKAI